MNKIRLKLLILFIIIFISTGDIDNNSVTYRSFIDSNNGFSRVTDDNGESSSYENYTLNINVGDSVVWINDDISDRLTIISEQKLWEGNDGALSYNGGRFKYVFNDIGTYTFHIKQDKTLPKQTIIVSNILVYVTPSTTYTETIATPYPTDTEVDISTPTISPIPDITNGNIVTPYPTVTEEGITTPTTSPIQDVTSGNISTNVTKAKEVQAISKISVNPILIPLDIVNNLKMTGMITFVIVAIIFFIKE